MTGIATARTPMSAAEVISAMVERRISVVCCLDGKLWTASADIKGDRDHNRKRTIRSETAIASTPLIAIERLVAKLGIQQPKQTELWEVTNG